MNKETTSLSRDKTLRTSGSQHRFQEIRGAYKMDKSLDAVALPKRTPSRTNLVILNSNSEEQLKP